MSEPAERIENDPVSTEGLEPLFDAEEPSSELRNQDIELCSEPISGEYHEVVSTEEAARRLGISPRAVIKRLKNGSLQGFRESNRTRAEWRIYWNEPTKEPGTDGSFEGTIRTEPERSHSTDGTNQKEPGGTPSDWYLVQLNKQLLEQVQTLTYQNGYLRAQLSEREQDIAERDDKIKLLTDSQYKEARWWQRFCSWFVGKRS